MTSANLIEKTIIVCEGATGKDIERMKETILKDAPLLLCPKNLKMYKLKKGELFEIVSSLKSLGINIYGKKQQKINFKEFEFND